MSVAARACWVLAVWCCSAAPGFAQVLPPDSGVIDVRKLGAVGDGVHDDTRALQAAIDAARIQPRYFWPTRIVYLPAGRYRVSNTLRSMDLTGRYQAQLALIGDGAASTSIVLANGSAGFGDRSEPKAVLFTSSGLRDGSPTAGGKRYQEAGEGNDAYANFVEGITIDVGERNPGAIAIDYLANNIGAIRDVVLRAAPGSGAIGLSMERRWPGPLLVSGLIVEGFRVGISVKRLEYGVTLQHVNLKRQEQVAIRNSANVLAMRDVRIATAAVGIVNDDLRGLIVADDLQFAPMSNEAVLADNVGYFTLRLGRTSATQAQLGVFFQGGTFLGKTRLASFGAEWSLLPAERASSPALPPVAAWANVVSFGAHRDTPRDASVAIQAAFDSGARAVYFPTGTYTIDRPLEIPASVEHIAGMMSVLRVGERTINFTREQGMLRVSTGGPTLTLQRLTLDNMDKGNQVGFEHSGSRSVMLRDFIGGGVSLSRRATGGKLVLENTIGSLNVAGPQGVWASQLNIEGFGVLIRNRGTPLSILGLKTEQNATVLENEEGGQTEIVGGLLYMVSPPVSPVVARPALMNIGAGRVFAAYVESAYLPGAIYLEHMVQRDPPERRVEVRASDLPARGLGRINPGRTLRGGLCGAKARAAGSCP